MKKLLMVAGMLFSVGNGLYATAFEQHLPLAVSDDAELMFDEAPDALDAVTTEDCECSSVKVFNPERETLFQAYYQTALMYLLSSYLSLKHSCESAKHYMASLLVWKPTTKTPTSFSSISE